MANEMDWLRAKARKGTDETMTITPDEAAGCGALAGRYRIERWAFNGSLPPRMMSALRAGSPVLVISDTETEVLKLGGRGYASERNACAYHRSVYTYLGP